MIIFQLPKLRKILTVQVAWVAVKVHNWEEVHSLTILLTELIHPLGLAIKRLLSKETLPILGRQHQDPQWRIHEQARLPQISLQERKQLLQLDLLAVEARSTTFMGKL